MMRPEPARPAPLPQRRHYEPQQGTVCTATMSNVVAARLLAKAAHGHVLDHACPQWADGPMRSIRGHRGSSLELKVAGPSMLGIRRPIVTCYRASPRRQCANRGGSLCAGHAH